MGSIGCKIASGAEKSQSFGQFWSGMLKHMYISLSPLKIEAILKAAGGAITNLDNNELRYGQPNFKQGGIIVASNNKLMHGSLCSEIEEIIRKNDIYPI